MTGLYVFLAVFLALLLLAQLRIGAVVEYSEDGLRVKLRAASFRTPVFPVATSDQKEKPRRGKKKKFAKSPAKETKGGLLELAVEFIPLVLETAGRLKRRLRVDQLKLKLTIAAADPADAAMQYGQANALLASLWEPMTQVFQVVDGRAGVGVDFNAAGSTLYLLASLSLTVGQVVSLVTVFGVKAAGLLMRRSRQRKQPIQREAV